MEDNSGQPDVTIRGTGEAEMVVIGGVHGDERSGIRAVRRLREADLGFRRVVVFVLTNPAAIDANERYHDADLNRVFPGDTNGNREEPSRLLLTANAMLT